MLACLIISAALTPMCSDMRPVLFVVNVVRRVSAIITVSLATFSIGLGSALNIDVLINQVYSCAYK